MRYLLIILYLVTCNITQAQTRVDSLKQEILKLQLDVEQIELGLQQGQKRFQSGVLVSAIGYSVTIAGGMMLGRQNDQLGQVLLVSGGATGLIGTYLLVDSFNFLSGRKRDKKRK